jgi:hypothetical protein
VCPQGTRALTGTKPAGAAAGPDLLAAPPAGPPTIPPTAPRGAMLAAMRRTAARLGRRPVGELRFPVRTPLADGGRAGRCVATRPGRASLIRCTHPGSSRSGTGRLCGWRGWACAHPGTPMARASPATRTWPSATPPPMPRPLRPGAPSMAPRKTGQRLGPVTAGEDTPIIRQGTSPAPEERGDRRRNRPPVPFRTSVMTHAAPSRPSSAGVTLIPAHAALMPPGRPHRGGRVTAPPGHSGRPAPPGHSGRPAPPGHSGR